MGSLAIYISVVLLLFSSMLVGLLVCLSYQILSLHCTVPHGDESAIQTPLNTVLSRSSATRPLLPQPLVSSLLHSELFKIPLFCSITLASTSLWNSCGQFLPQSTLSLPPSSTASTSTESSLENSPFSSPAQPCKTLDNYTPPTLPAPAPPCATPTSAPSTCITHSR